MPTLKDISVRLKSVKNIQKITASMKMVSAAKYARAERELKQARPYGEGAKVSDFIVEQYISILQQRVSSFEGHMISQVCLGYKSCMV